MEVYALHKRKMINTPKNRKQVYEAFSTGFDSPEIVAYHGTSLQVLKRIIETGLHTSNDVFGNNKFPQHYRMGEVYVYPIDGRAVLPFTMEMFTDEKAQDGARIYAETIARDHWLAEKLGIDPFQARYRILSDGQVDDGDITRLKNVALTATGREYTWSEACKLHDGLKSINGLIIAYSQRIFDNGEPLPVAEGGEEEHAVRIKNVNICSLAGIEPLDQESYDFLSSLEA